MFRVKICGVTTAADARAACDAGADAVGINFYSGSPRCCTLDQARDVAAAIGPRVCRVGVFVNAPVGEIKRAAADLELDLIQLHGQEPPETLRALRPLPVMKVFGLDGDPQTTAEYLDACHRLRAMPRMVLVDAVRDGQSGGTGVTLDWDLVRRRRPEWRGLPLVLAGGLNPRNVEQAILTVRPWAVDVASGVEQAPGRKSPELIEQFVNAADTAFLAWRHR